MKRYQKISRVLSAIENCEKHNNTVWLPSWEERLDKLMEGAPSGSGFDAGTNLDREKSNPERLVFSTSYHHMNEHGLYDGWTEHNVTITGSLGFRFDTKISGRNRNDIKPTIEEIFNHWLEEEVPDVD